MKITATEFKINIDRYLKLSETEDVFITQNEKVIAELSNPYKDRLAIANSLFDIISDNKDIPTTIGNLSKEELDIELQKGIDSLKDEKIYSADEIDAELSDEFDI